jgi:hypothetical protein
MTLCDRFFAAVVYVQDDWELIRPLDIGPAADLLLAHDDLGGVRFWASTGYVGEFEGHLVIDPAAAWSYGDNPALWHTRFAERVGPFDVGGFFGHHEELGRSSLRRLVGFPGSAVRPGTQHAVPQLRHAPNRRRGVRSA